MYEKIMNDIEHFFDDKSRDDIIRFFKEIEVENKFPGISAKNFIKKSLNSNKGDHMNFNNQNQETTMIEIQKISWSEILNTSHHIYGNITVAQEMAEKLNYPYYMLNERIIDTKSHKIVNNAVAI